MLCLLVFVVNWVVVYIGLGTEYCACMIVSVGVGLSGNVSANACFDDIPNY